MKKRFVLSLMLILALFGCTVKQDVQNHSEYGTEIVYHSEVAPEDCYICGDKAENLQTVNWGQSNVALVSLNTFEVKPIEINRYDIDGHLIEEVSGVMSFGGGQSVEGGFSAHLMQDYDRGYATGTLDFYNDEKLDIDKLSSFLCEDCLNNILPWDLEQCFGVGVINLETKEIHALQEKITGFGIGDFYVDCNLLERNKETGRMDLLIFYCPVRYK